jgi:hypothetical protein
MAAATCCAACFPCASAAALGRPEAATDMWPYSLVNHVRKNQTRMRRRIMMMLMISPNC